MDNKRDWEIGYWLEDGDANYYHCEAPNIDEAIKKALKDKILLEEIFSIVDMEYND